MQIRRVLKRGHDMLVGVDHHQPSLEARVLLCNVLDKSHEQMLIAFDQEIDQLQSTRFFELVERRINGEPISYITGRKEFYGREFKVSKDVLIPRPETEMIIDHVLENFDQNKPLKILDLGTGSGAIAVTLAAELMLAEIIATDISESALKIAKQNAIKQQVSGQIEFVESDWYKNLPSYKFAKKSDLIISNPPYISYEESGLVADETQKYEPHLSLFAQRNGLSCYHEILQSAKEYLAPEGKIILEHGFRQADEIVKIASNYGLSISNIIADLSGLPRIIILQI